MSEAPEYAKGLEGVIANESALSQVLGLDGILRYRGYHIDDLVEKTGMVMMRIEKPGVGDSDGNCADCCSLGAQYARPEADGCKLGLLRSLNL